MRRVSRRALIRIVAVGLAGAGAGATAPAEAATGSPLQLKVSGGAIQLRIFNEYTYLGAVLYDACVERAPRLTVTARPNPSTAPTINARLGAVWTSTLVPQAPQFAGARIDVPQNEPLVVDPTTAFARFTGGGGLGGQVPVGFGPGVGIVWIAAYRDVTVGASKLQQYSNAVAIPTLVTRSGTTCRSERVINLWSGRIDVPR